MYWTNSNSTIDTLLAQEGVTLESILNQDDVLQECIGQNNSLLAFLSDDVHLTEMLTVLLNEPDEIINDMESRYKNANTVCEILTYEGNIFADIIAKNDKYLSQLWSFVSVDCSEESQNNDTSSQPTSLLNPLLASFFTKVFNYLFTHRIDQVLDFLAQQESPNDLVSIILRHINTSAIMDFVYKTWEYINMDKKIGQEKIDKYNQLLVKNSFIEKLIEIFKDKTADSKQQNSANLVSDLVKTGRELLIQNSKDQVAGILEEFEKTNVSRTLLGNMFESQTKHSIVSGLKIIQDLLVYRIQLQQLINQHEQLSSLDGGKSDVQDDNLDGMPTFLKASSSPSSNEVQFMPPQLSSPVDVHGEHLSRCVRNVCAALCERLEDFVDLLKNPKGLLPISSTVGVIKCPLGLIRLEVIHLFVALFATSDYSILEKCSQLGVLEILTDLFFEYSLNNQLHKYYEQIIEYLFQNYSNFKIIYDKYSSNEVTNDNSTAAASSQSSANDESSDTNNNNNENNFEVISHAKSEATASGNNGNSSPLNNEKILYFIKLFKMTKVLVKQVIIDCRLIEKILDSFAQEKVPVKSSQKLQEEKPKAEEPAVCICADHPVITDDGSSDTVTQEQIKIETNEKTDVNLTESNAVEKESEVPEINVKSELEPEIKPEVPLIKTLRPGYLGHLRLIANVLKERCSDELLYECGVQSEVIQKWNEFKTGKLTLLNELINSKLVEESKYNESNDQEIFHKYQIESLSQNLPSSIELLPSDFGQSSLGDINQQIKLMSGPDFDFDKYWTQTNEKLCDFEKYFDEKCSSIFDDEDDDSLNRTSENPLGTIYKKERPSLLSTTLKTDFVTFDDPFLSNNESKDELIEAGFANFSHMNSNPWGENSNQAATNEASKEVGQSPTWAADFSNDPFDNSEISVKVETNHDAEVHADFSTNLPNTSSPKKEEEQ